MKHLAALVSAVVFSTAAMAADPTLEIKPTGTTNGTNSVIIEFEVKNLPDGIGISGVTPVQELKINGNVINANTYAVTVTGTTGKITVNGALQPGKAPVVLKVNLTGNKPAVSQTKEVDFKSAEKKEEELGVG
ncbi:MAG: hypothetical protein MUF18_04685 [Fimbriiglobus sp.]|nr:hypothetical protein [Fimbriiglobus sp.]